MRWLTILLALAAGAAAAQDRWFAPRLWLRAIAHDASGVIVEPQSGFWPEGMWLVVGLDGSVAEAPPPKGCLWTAMANDPVGGRRAAAAFCPAPACRDARAVLEVDGEITWTSRGRHLSELVWSANASVIGGVLSRFEGAQALGLGSLGGAELCERAPIGVVEFGAGETVSRLPALLPASTSGLRLIGHDGRRWLATIGFVRPKAFVSHPPIASALDEYCEANSAPEFGRPCSVVVGAILAQLDRDEAKAVMLGGGPVTARTLVGPGAEFVITETCAVERLSRLRIRSRCDLLRWDAPFNASEQLTEGGAVLGGLALSGDGRMIAALNPFAGADSRLTLIDAATGVMREHPIGDWIRVAFEATGRRGQVGDEE